MEQEGSKQIEIIVKDNKRHFTAGSSPGDFLLSQFQFPSTWNVMKLENNWCNECTMIEYISEIILPYVNEKERFET